MNELIPFGLSALDLVTILAGITAFIAVLAVWQSGIVARDPMKGRIKQLQERRQALRAGLITEPKRRTSPIRKAQGLNVMRSVVKKLKLAQSETTQKVSKKMMQAGWRQKDAVIIYLFFKMVLPALIAISSLLLVYGYDAFADSPMLKVLLPPGAILIAFMGPDLVVKNQIQKRMAAIRKALPDALDLMVICAEAGLTLDSAFQRVTGEMGKSAPELGDEFGLTTVELGFLPDRRQALMNLAERVPLPSVRGVVTTLVQTERYGTPLAMSLRVLSAEFRNERMMKAEEKAARLPATMTVPLILFILPTLFVVLLGPAACQISDELINR
ncbi:MULTISPECIES: type II secretion system F family protein [Iodidimonas]|jgi:tight adherence protein C|uniref:Type II secretion system protein n=1 Tax=Iodidimonas nitroreducens TaxID=1236968 RepID=A0A5A7N7G4_9PROT|nr:MULTISPECIES: type II secretion system F family protein [Iodidimonas]GAK34370.1 flp pilus assembly protein TadB [alpha proteobacterium Q-1]GER03917.1 type II secretion system protein [Iodidimonas nitroreducens]